MLLSYTKINPYLGAIIIFFTLSLVVNYFAVPNMLSHDKLSNELYLLKSGNPELFANDYALEGASWRFFYVPFVEMLRLANRFTGSSEETYRILVPILFFVFTSGMFVFFYRLGNSFWASIFTAVVSSVYIPEVLHENWGIPGPSMILHRHMALALLPIAYFLFYQYINNAKLLIVFFLVGLIGNIHPVSSFYVTLIFLITLLFAHGFRKETIKKAFLSGLAALLGITPFLIWHFILYPANGDLFIINDEPYLNAVWEAQPHVSPAGMTNLYFRTFITNWYAFWPLTGIFFLTAWLWSKKNDESKKGFLRTSMILFWATALVTITISAGQQILQIFFKIAPLTIEEPRAFRFIYFVLYLHLAYLLSFTHELFRSYRYALSMRQKLAAAAIVIFITIFAGFLLQQKISRAAFLLSLKKNEPDSGNTCRLPMYGWISGHTPQDSIFLINPNIFPAFRICALRGLVNHYRDVPPAILSRDKIVEWARRKHIIETAYAGNNPQKIKLAADQFNAAYIITENCLILPELQKIYEDNGNNCIYAVKNNY